MGATEHGAGFFPFDPADCGESVCRLVAELTAPAFANAIGARLDVTDLANLPTLVTLCRSLNLRHGSIHTDRLLEGGDRLALSQSGLDR